MLARHDRAFDRFDRVACQQLQDADVMPGTGPRPVPLFEDRPQPHERRRQLPFGEQPGLVQVRGLATQHAQAVQWLQHLLARRPAPRVPGDGRAVVDDDDLIQVCLDRHVLEGVVQLRAPDLAILTTTLEPGRLLTTMGDTSAAAAAAARYAALIWSQCPDLWPETIRALLIHSASWTPAMQAALEGSTQATRILTLIRAFGYGVPNLERALYSTQSSAVLFAESEIQPYRIDPETGRARANVLHLHSLPWPRDLLLSLGDRTMRMRVTLSYFVDADPERIAGQPHRYQSHGLRFAVRRLGESDEHFLQSLTKEEWEEGQRPENISKDERWALGRNGRVHGSIHCDWWEGRAADLADLGFIAVHPVSGWWQERAHLGLVNSQARYSLIASLESEMDDVQLYAAIEQTAEATAAVEPTTIML